VLATLETIEEGRDVKERALRVASPRICFGPIGASAVTTEGVILLDDALGEAEAAARVGHLLVHVERGSPLAPQVDPSRCEEAVDRALTAEASALELELRLRRALGVLSPRVRYAFEEEVVRAAPEARVGRIKAYLQAHPHGAPGLDALAAGYRQRCLEGRP
jgi:hypothetical protein